MLLSFRFLYFRIFQCTYDNNIFTLQKTNKRNYLSMNYNFVRYILAHLLVNIPHFTYFLFSILAILM